MPQVSTPSRGPRLSCWAVMGAAVAVLCAPAAAKDRSRNSVQPAPAVQTFAQAAAASIEARLRTNAPIELSSFYDDRQYQPLWANQDGSLNPAARDLLRLVETADLDSMDPASLNAAELASAILAAETAGTPAAIAEADIVLSSAMAAYAGALLSSSDPRMIYEHPLLEPYRLTGKTVLEQAAKAPSLHDYLAQMQWMHPLYSQLRNALGSDRGSADRSQLIENLVRVRGIPRVLSGRHVIVDAGSARLWMYEGDQVVDTMKLVVGSAKTPTPIMAGYIRTAVFNPYWNVPIAQVRRTIAPRARNMGVGYLKRGGYQVVSSWEPDAEVLDPSGINWRSVEAGELDVIVRQLPSAFSAMGKMKFELPNPQGIYLHDTPDKALMLKDARHLSNGCIRLEDAARFGRWLMSSPLPAGAGAAEQRVDLAEPVPIYITYLTAPIDGGQIAFGPDPYSLYGGQALGTGGLARPQ